MSERSRPYHHGNLRDALIEAAAALIEERGSLEFSITDAAKRAGVSNAAPYRHFKDKEDLLGEVRELAFLGLYQSLKTLSDTCPHKPGTVGHIIALGHGYLLYARQKRPFFSLMWEQRGGEDAQREHMGHRLSGFNLLLNAVTHYCEIQGHISPQEPHHRGPSVDTLNVATQLWALAHGIATLEANEMLDTFDPSANPEQLLTESSHALLTGLQLDRPRRVDPQADASAAGQAELPW